MLLGKYNNNFLSVCLFYFGNEITCITDKLYINDTTTFNRTDTLY